MSAAAPTPCAAYAGALQAALAAVDAAAKSQALAQAETPQDAELAQAASAPIAGPPALPQVPGRDPAWRVDPAGSGRRRGSLAQLANRRRFLHAIFHIELSAVDLACALALLGLRANAPSAFHADMLRVAREEAEHAQLLADWLGENGAPPGSFPVHHRLWQALLACADLGEALVVVPRYLEARGLDVAADVQPRLALHDARAGAILARIHADEIGHVGIGTRWHGWWCQARGLDRGRHFAQVVRARFADQLPSPFVLDRVGRLRAGFQDDELAVLAQAPGGGSAREDPQRHGV